MRLTDEQIAAYQRLYLETFGVPVSKGDAARQGMALLRLVRILMGHTVSTKRDSEEVLQ